MTIDFVSKEFEARKKVTPSIKFCNDLDGYHDATIYIDHIPVAYFDSITGGIVTIPLEVAMGAYGDNNRDDSTDVKYLQDRGFKLIAQENPLRGAGFMDYYISLEGPRR